MTHLLYSLGKLHDMKGVLNYAELISEIETCISFDVKNIFSCIIYDPERGADALKELKNILVYLRDSKNDELKAMSTKESSISASIMFYLLKTTLKIRETVKYFIRTYDKHINDDVCKAYIYPYLCSLDDAVEVIAYRHLKLFLNDYKYSPDMQNYLPNLSKKLLYHFSRKGCKPKDFNNTLQEKLGVDLEVSHLLEPDSECAICGESLDANSDFAVLDTCSHLMCTDCAEVTLMGNVVDLIPMGGETDDENDNDDHHGHIVQLGKIPKCPCCRRKVGQWTTTHIMKFSQINGCHFWDINLLPQDPISIFDIFQNCINECIHIRYSIPFMWMTICKHVRILAIAADFRQNEFADVVHVIERVLELHQAEDRDVENFFETRNMSDIVRLLNHLVSSKIIENSTSIQQLLINIKSIIKPDQS